MANDARVQIDSAATLPPSPTPVPQPHPKLARPPIVESLIDYRFGSLVSIQEVQAACAALALEFPVREEQWTRREEKQGASVTSVQEELTGYRLLSADRLDHIQISTSGYTSNRLAPYRSWEHLITRTAITWMKAAPILGKPPIVRVGHRTINYFEIPLPISDLSDYLRLGPGLPPDYPRSFINSSMRLEFALGADKIAIVKQRWGGAGPTAEAVAVLIDMDVISNGSCASDSPDLLANLNSLHTHRNDLFFGSITERAQALFA